MKHFTNCEQTTFSGANMKYFAFTWLLMCATATSQVLLAPIDGTPYVGGNKPGFNSVNSSGLQVLIKNNLTASTAPAPTDDTNSNYAVGSIWINTTADRTYVCVDASASAAVWTETSAATTSAILAAALTDETGSGAAVFGTSPTIATPTISGAISFPDDVLQTFNPGATNSGFNVGSLAGDPSAPTNGDLWYDSTANELTARINGASVALGAGGSSLWTDGGTTTYLTSTTDDLAVGGATETTAAVFFDESASSIAASDASGVNTAATNLTLEPGQSTGSATPASIVLRSTVAGGSGSAAQTLSDTLTVSNGAVGIGFPPQSGRKLYVYGGDVTFNQPSVSSFLEHKYQCGSITNQYQFGSSYSTAGRFVQGSHLLESTGTGGLGLSASDASSQIAFWIGGNTEIARADATGVLLGTTTSPTGTTGKVMTFGDNAGDPTMGTDTAGVYANDIASSNVTPFASDETNNRNPLVPYSTAVTLGAAATTFVADSNLVVVTGDAGANTVATITGARAYAGSHVTLLFVDGLVTITDTDAHTANTVDLAGSATDFTSADDTILECVHDGTSWYEVSRSVN